MKAECKNVPKIRKLQGGVILPCNTYQVNRNTEDGNKETFYIYEKINLHQQNLPNLQQAIQHICKKLKSDLHEYVYNLYDPNTQQTIQAYAQKANRIGRSDIQDECEKVFNWIDNVLVYYDQCKANIKSATNESELILITWNFENGVSVPNDLLGWRDIKNMFD